MRGSSSGEAAPVGAGAPGGERDRSHGPPATGGPTPTPRGGASDAAASAGAASAGGPVGGASPARRAPARPLQRVVGYELRRLGGSFGARVLFVLPALLGAAAVLRRALEVRIEAGRVASGQLYSTTAVNAFEGLAVGLRAALPLLAGVAVGWATQAIAGELSRGTLANVAARPITRTQLGLGKLLAALLAALGGLVLAVGTCAAVAGLAFDYEGVVEILPNGKTYPYVTAQELLAPIPSVLVAPLVALVALTVLGFLVGALVRSGTAALALGLGGVLLLELARAPARLLGHEALIPTAHLPTPLGAGSSVDAWLELCRGISGASLPPVAPALGSAALWGGAALVLSLLAVRRRSIA